MSYNFCTYFDHNYLARGMTLYYSLFRVCSDFTLYILCLTKETYEILHQQHLKNVILIKLKDLEESEPRLLQIKDNRTAIEYYFTLTPCLPYYVIHHFNDIELITYLDCDLYFLADPKEIFEEIDNNSVAIISHRFSKENKKLEVYGLYNVGWISFRNDNNGIQCLKWYKDKCLEWCYDKLEDTRYADQKYLNFFSDKFEGVCEISHKGANLAPWNVDNYNISLKCSNLFADEDKIIFFHVQSFKKIFFNIYTSCFYNYHASFTKLIKIYIYKPYLKKLLFYNKYIHKKSNINDIRHTKSNYRILQLVFPRIIIYYRKIRLLVKGVKYNTLVWYISSKK